MSGIIGDGKIKYTNPNKTIKIKDYKQTIEDNRIFNRNDIDLYTRFSRFGYVDLYRHQTGTREYLFFTKPDMNLFNSAGTALAKKGVPVNGKYEESLSTMPDFIDLFNRYPFAMSQLQSSCKLTEGPFMNILTNSVTSKLDLPDITAESQTTTGNIMGIDMSVRGHSIKSNVGYDFTLSFNDPSKEIYNMLVAYDTYHNVCKTGEHTPKMKYITTPTFDDQFSIYKFIVANDAETILFAAWLIGCYFANVPRGDFGDPTEFGKYSVSFHSQFICDKMAILVPSFLNTVSKYASENMQYAEVVRDSGYSYPVNTEWVKLPWIEISNDARAKRNGPVGTATYYDYRLKWLI